MAYKGMVFTDLDGTILFRDKNKKDEIVPFIKKEDLKALKRLRESGYIIVVATGREKSGIRKFLQQSLVAFDYYVGSNGGLILDQNFNIIEKSFIPKKVMVEVLTYVKENYPEVDLMGTDGEKMVFFDSVYSNAQVQATKFNADITTFAAYKENDMEFVMMNLHPNQTITENREGLIVQIETDLLKRFGDKLNMFHNQDFLDFAPLNISKGYAVETLARREQITLNQVHVIGDSWNDLSMFKTEAMSYSFNHADQEIQQSVDHVVDSFAAMVEKLHLLD
ncbi:MAG: HAD-IIB family hydrolase [Culicoidibacterales bacterium]